MIPPFVGERRPFELALPPTAPWEKTKMALLWPLAVVRMVLIAAVLVCAWLLSLPALCCHPHGRARMLWLLPIRLLLRLVGFINGFFWIPVVQPPGEQRPASAGRKVAPAFIVANHVGRWDVWKLVCDHGCGVVVDKGLLGVPLLGRVFCAFGSIGVDRKSRDSRAAARQALCEHAERWRTAMAAAEVSGPASLPFRPLLVFAEGCTTPDCVLTKFQVGAFAALLPVLPIVVSYPAQQ